MPLADIDTHGDVSTLIVQAGRVIERLQALQAALDRRSDELRRSAA